jgi:hypothetical protein
MDHSALIRGWVEGDEVCEIAGLRPIALLWSQPGCTNIACGNTWVQNDHREPYAKVKSTVLPNIDPLCPQDTT